MPSFPALRLRYGILVCVLLSWAGAASGAELPGNALLNDRCASCHNLAGPAPDTVEGIRDRKGPDLFYAGNKYRPEWLVAWLQAPTRIRPAGMFYGHHTRSTDKWDVVDPDGLTEHVRLEPSEAENVTAALMERRAMAEFVAGVPVKKVRLSPMMGNLMFNKFKGCISCHRSSPDYGGLSGPELYTAANRLTPEYLYAYMRNPQGVDPRIWMPNPNLNERDLNRFVRYMEIIAAKMEIIAAKVDP